MFDNEFLSSAWLLVWKFKLVFFLISILAIYEPSLKCLWLLHPKKCTLPMNHESVYILRKKEIVSTKQAIFNNILACAYVLILHLHAIHIQITSAWDNSV